MSGVPEVMVLAAELFAARGVRAINRLPGCYEGKIDERWTFAANAHAETKSASPAGCMSVEVPRFAMAFWWNGWLAGIVDAAGGAIAAHPDGASEERLCADLRAAIEGERA